MSNTVSSLHYTHMSVMNQQRKRKNWQKKKKKLSAEVSGVMVWRGRRGTTPLTCTWQQEPARMGHVRVVVMRKGHTSQRQALHLRTCFCGRAMARLDACTSWGPGCAHITSGMIGTSCVAVSRLRSTWVSRMDLQAPSIPGPVWRWPYELVELCPE